MQRPLPRFIYLFIFCLYHKKSWCAQLVGRQTSRKIISTSEQSRFRSSIIYDEEYLRSRKISIVQYLLHFLMDITIFFLLLCLLQTLPLSSSNTLHTLKGTSLSVEKPSDKLVSENGEFSTGVFLVRDNAFCFAIWLNKSSTSTIVWMANWDETVNGRGSVLSISVDGQLILTNSLGITIWTTKATDLTLSEVTNLQLQLQNTGNLILHNSKDVVICQSFDAPSDTLLPQ